MRTSLAARALVAQMRWRRTSAFYDDARVMRTELAAHQDPAATRPPRCLRAVTDVGHERVDGYDCWTLRPPWGARSDVHVRHLHGGGFVEQPGPHHWRFARWLVGRLGATVTLPMYPLVPAPARIGLFSPWLDLGVSDPLSARIAPHDPALGIEGLRQAGRWYAAGSALDDPEISPVHADLRGLGRIAAFVGTRDLLLADARRLRRDAEQVGQEIELDEYPGMVHNWIMQPLPDAATARRHLREFLRR